MTRRCASPTSRPSPRRIPPPKSGSVETMTSLLTEGLVARGHDVTLFATGDSTTTRDAARDLPARLLARREHVAVGAVRDAEPGGRRRARRASSTSSTTRRRTTRCRWRSRGCRRRRSSRRCTTRRAPRRSALWSRYPEAPFVAISNEQARLLDGPQRRRAPCCTASTPTVSRSASTPDDYLLFLGRFTEGKGVLQAIEIAKRVGMRLILAAAEDDYYREHVAPHVDGKQIVYYRRGRFRHEGEAVRRRARAALPDSGARAVRAGARRSDGLRHAGRRARSRRRARGRRRRRDRHGLQRRTRADGRPGRVFRSRSPARPRAGGRAVRRERMVDEYIAVYKRLVEDPIDARRLTRWTSGCAHDPPDRPLAGRRLLGDLRAPGRRVAGVRWHAGHVCGRRGTRRRCLRDARRGRPAQPGMLGGGRPRRGSPRGAARRRRTASGSTK